MPVLTETGGQNEVALILDGGTTNSRLWATRPNGDVIAEARTEVGARDGLSDRHPVASAVADMVASVTARCGSLGFVPKVVVAGGMVTSPSGLFNVPHSLGPVDLAALATAARQEFLPAVCALPFVFIPGVKWVSTQAQSLCPDEAAAAMASSDLVRGEELLSLGLHAQGVLPNGGMVISLGSHWKRIEVSAAGSLMGCRSSLTGEMVAAVSEHTILAESLPSVPPEALDLTWLLCGARAALARGLPRALYEVRLLAITTTSTAEQRYAFLWGAAFGADLLHLLPSSPAPLFAVGRESLCLALTTLAREHHRDVTCLAPETAEAAFRAGCLQILNQIEGVTTI